MIDFETFQNGIEATKGAINILKGAKDLIPEGKNKEEATKQIEEAERLLKLADAKVAQELGYSLCRCSFPPQIMIENKVGKSICPNCGKIEGEVKLEDNTNEIDGEQLAILMVLLDIGNNEITLEHLSRKLNGNEVKIKYYLKKLVDDKYVTAFYNMVHPTQYQLAHKGTEYLIKIGAL